MEKGSWEFLLWGSGLKNQLQGLRSLQRHRFKPWPSAWAKGFRVAAAEAWIQSLVQELPHALGQDLEKKKKKKKNRRKAGELEVPRPQKASEVRTNGVWLKEGVSPQGPCQASPTRISHRASSPEGLKP